jgi:diguanylate cyclase (GGDEF)-like protein
MNRTFLGIFGLLACMAAMTKAQVPGPLTSIEQVCALSNLEGSRKLPVDLEATLTFTATTNSSIFRHIFFLQNSKCAIFAAGPEMSVEKFLPGDVVQVQGTTIDSFRPIVMLNAISLRRHGARPAPIETSFQQLVSGQRDAQLVRVRGVVRSVDYVPAGPYAHTAIELLLEGGYVSVVVSKTASIKREDLLDATVEVTGAAAGIFDGKMQMAGVQVLVSDLDDVKILKPAVASPRNLPLTPMDQILSQYDVTDHSNRARVSGTVTYYQPGAMLVLQSGERSLRIFSRESELLPIGSVVSATGFPDVIDNYLALLRSEILPTGQMSPVAARPVKWQEATNGKDTFDLVSIEGTVVAQVQEAAQDSYVVESDGHIFSAVLHRPASAITDPLHLPQFPKGSRVRVTGICSMEGPNPPPSSSVPFDLLLRSNADVVLIAKAPWFNVRHMAILIALLFATILLVTTWGWTLRRKVRQQTAALTASIEAEAARERSNSRQLLQRSRIMEAVNSDAPLLGILEDIAAGLSSQLGGVKCWFNLADGSRLGSPPEASSVSVQIGRAVLSRSGRPMGSLHVNVTNGAPLNDEAEAALNMAIHLAALAIENRHLHAELVHRSEFDMLTELPNRFYMERHLDQLLRETPPNDAVFALIYIDLDLFKQVNDSFGHRVGDLYLQHVAMRMKNQLRVGDSLSRLGGDEFAALLPSIPNPATFHEVANRLEHCFDAPFQIEGNEILGSASLGVAIYPKNGTSAEALQQFADKAMYAAKHEHRERLQFDPPSL